jgi:hypothetical protein
MAGGEAGDDGRSGPGGPDSADATERLHLPPSAFDGFDVQVMVDRAVYAPGETVRITVTAANQGARFVEHRYPGWQRFSTTVRDDHHRVVAEDEVLRAADGPAVDRWLPGQMVIWPMYWNQHRGPLVPAWTQEPPGPPAEPGRYRIRVTWLGREPGARDRLADVWSAPFELT